MLFFKPRSPVSFSKKLLLLAYAILLATNRAMAGEMTSPEKDAHVRCPIIVNCMASGINACVAEGGNPELFRLVQGQTLVEIGQYQFSGVHVYRGSLDTNNNVDCQFTMGTGKGGTLRTRIINDHIIHANMGEMGWTGNDTNAWCNAGFDCTLLMRK